MQTTKIIKDKLYLFREKNLRLRTIFIKFRKMKKFQYLSDSAILFVLVALLKETKQGVSKLEIYSTFKLVDPDDYDIKEKNQILKGLLEGAKNRSVLLKPLETQNSKNCLNKGEKGII